MNMSSMNEDINSRQWCQQCFRKRTSKQLDKNLPDVKSFYSFFFFFFFFTDLSFMFLLFLEIITDFIFNEIM